MASRCARLLRRVCVAHPLPAPAVEPITLITSSTSRRFSLCSKRSTSRSVCSSNFSSSLKLGFIALKLSCVSFFVCTRGFFASSRSRAHRSMTLPLATEDDMVAARWRRRKRRGRREGRRGSWARLRGRRVPGWERQGRDEGACLARTSSGRAHTVTQLGHLSALQFVAAPLHPPLPGGGSGGVGRGGSRGV